MEVVAPPSLRSISECWASSDPGAYPAVPPTELMTDIMAYQYPPPPPGADMDMPPTGYLPSYPAPPHASSAMDPDPTVSPRDRSDSLKLKRSISTPVVGLSQGQGQSAQTTGPQQSIAPGQDPSGERRRNKLGYHRTSVACGHCRRRKIRCVPSPSDVQGRCINCIRLKKECSFYPVDQQPPLDTRQKSGSRSSMGPKIPSASSSPAMQPGIPSDIHGHQPYSQLAMPSIQNMAPPVKSSGSEIYPPDPKMPSSASSGRAYEYGQHGMTNWMSADTSPNSSKPSDWRSYPSDSPVTPAFSPYTHAPPPSATWSASVSSEPTRDEIAWSSYPAPPSRSLSFSAESMSGHQQYPSMSQVSSHSSRSYERKSSAVSANSVYPPTIATTIPGIETIPGTTMDPNASLSAGAVPPSSYASWQQPYSYAKPGESYSGWYGETGDQQSSGHGHSGPNAYYGR